jgi:ubiquinone/menaquinone biosynthesis C-methylase UbiE
MKNKDYFSGHSKIYAAFRPSYPTELYNFILTHVKSPSAAWDCATGNGQVAKILAQHFQKVFATDISQQQLDNAVAAENIFYSVSPAEKTSFENDQFDLITVGQALHWFQADAFYQEVKRVGKQGGIIAVWGYSLCKVNAKIDDIFLNFYTNIVGPYWDDARKLVEQEYATIPFPFEEIKSPAFAIKVFWTRDEFTGYLTSWSATQKYMAVNKTNPVEPVDRELAVFWKDNEIKSVTFPVFVRTGIIKK